MQIKKIWILIIKWFHEMKIIYWAIVNLSILHHEYTFTIREFSNYIRWIFLVLIQYLYFIIRCTIFKFLIREPFFVWELTIEHELWPWINYWRIFIWLMHLVRGKFKEKQNVKAWVWFPKPPNTLPNFLSAKQIPFYQ